MLAIVLFLTIVSIIASGGLIVLSLLGIVLKVLSFAGKTSFRIAKFGLKLASFAVVGAVAIVSLLVIAII